jgi:hypothetical protein
MYILIDCHLGPHRCSCLAVDRKRCSHLDARSTRYPASQTVEGGKEGLSVPTIRESHSGIVPGHGVVLSRRKKVTT